MLDNASGSATILDIAEQMQNVNPRNKLRFIWFGGEELGLLGSEYYVNNLSSNRAESHRLRPRRGRDGDAELPDRRPRSGRHRTCSAGRSRRRSRTDVYEPSKVARDQAVDYLDSIGKNHVFLSPVGTDAFSFNKVGVPASGVLTGQDCCKTQEEVDLFGGQLGNYEGNLADASTEAASTTRSAGATTSTTTTPRS